MIVQTDMYHAKKTVSGTFLLLVLLLVTVAASLILTTLVLAAFDENPDTNASPVIFPSDLFSELLRHLDPFPKVFAAVGSWTEHESGTTRSLNQIQFTNSTHGYAVGNLRTYTSTTDGGVTWKQRDIAFSDDIYSIHFTDENRGWAVGEGGKIRYTSDGGKTWVGQSNTNISDVDLYDVYSNIGGAATAVGDSGRILNTGGNTTQWGLATNSNTANLRAIHIPTTLHNGWAVGEYGTIITNKDSAGNDWVTQESGLDNYHLNDVFFISLTHGWVVGNGGTILVTVNGGTTWTAQESNLDTALYGVQFINSNDGWAVGINGQVISTTDGGKTWDNQDSITNEELYDLYVIDSNNIWVVGNNGFLVNFIDTRPTLIDSTLNLLTGTLTFEFDEIVNVSATNLSGITITDSSGRNGVTLTGATISGGGGDSDTLTIRLTEEQRRSLTLLQHGPRSLLKVDIAATAIQDTRDNYTGVTNAQLSLLDDLAANTWTLQTTPDNTRLLGVHFANENHGWAVGLNGTLFNTANGGTTWSSRTHGTNTVLRDVHLLDSGIGWAAGNNGTIIHTVVADNTAWSSPVEISDGGTNSGTTSTFYDIDFVGPDNGWAVGAGGTIVRTTNGGSNWNMTNSETSVDLRAAHFTGVGPGWAVGVNGKVVITTDNGKTWNDEQPSITNATLNDVYFADTNRGWAVGDAGTIIGTINGLNWNILDSGTNVNLNGVHFTDLNHGWAAGTGGTVLVTTNGGLTWHVQNTPTTQFLYGIHFTDSGHGWAVGHNGTVLRGSFSDALPPLLTDATPDFDLNANTLLLEFDKVIDVSKVLLSGITITDENGQNVFTLTGATPPTIDSAALTISLSETQRQLLSLFKNGSNTQLLQIDVSSTAVRDINGNRFAGITDGPISLVNVMPVNTWVKEGRDRDFRILGIHATSTNHGVAVGDNGRVAFYDNIGIGTLWNSSILFGNNTDFTIRDVHYLNSNSGWAVGGGGSLLYDANGGGNGLVLQSSGTTESLYDIDFVGTTKGWAVGDNGVIIRTTDSGTTWSVGNATNNTFDLRGAHFTGAGPGWAVGTGGTIVVTGNDGESWSAQSSGTTATLNDVYFINANHGWAVGADGTILGTINRGADWNTLDSRTNVQLNAVHFIDFDHGWAVGTGGTVLATVNGGTTWNVESTPTTESLFGVHFSSSGHGWAVGNDGTILRGSFATTTMPPLLDDTPYLDLFLGTLRLEFDKTIDVSDTNLSKITITDRDGKNSVSMDGARLLSGSDIDTLTILLSESQRQSITLLQHGTKSPLQITISATAISDTDGINYAGINNTELIVNSIPPIVSNDNKRPLLIDPTPDLDLDSRILRFEFDERINASEINLLGITITDSNGANGVVLADATQPNSNSTTVTISLNESQRQSISLLQLGAALPLEIDVGSSVIRDIAGNNFVGLVDAPMSIHNDQEVDDWVEQISNTDTRRLLDTHFTDTNNGWAVGNDGLALNTTDGGETWSVVNVGVNSHIRSVHFADSNRGWVVGDSGTVRTTSNGGTTWNSTASGTTSNSLFDVQFINSTNGWAVGNGGTIIRTTNGGTSWSVNSNSGTTSDLRGIHFSGPGRPGWAVGAGGTIVIAGSDGVTWSAQDSGTTATLNAVHSIDANRVWAVGAGGTILSTVNRGITWSAQDSGTTTTNLNSVHFTNENYGWAVGAGGIIIYTINGGATWNTQSTPVTDTLYGVHFIDSSHGWAVGDNGTILNGIFSDKIPPYLTDETPDLDLRAGTLLLVFNEIIDVSTVTLSDIRISGRITGVGSIAISINGARLSATSDSAILEILLTERQRENISSLLQDSDSQSITISSNVIRDLGGNFFAGIANGPLSLVNVSLLNAWVSQTSNTNPHLLGVHFINSTHGWAVGNSGALTTTTNGTTWSAGSIGTSNAMRDVHFVNVNNGWAVGNSGAMRTTTDGGITWSNQTSGTTESLHNIHFVGSDLGWVVGDKGTIISTTDGGLSWNSDTSGTTSDLRGIHFSGPGRPGWAVGAGGTILNAPSTIGSWSAQTSGTIATLNDVYFIDANRGWIVGANGTILGTVNRGANWNVLNSGTTANLNGVYFADSGNGWAAGAGGTIITTSNGGTTWSVQSTPTTNSLRDIHFSGPSSGWAVGHDGTILHGAFVDMKPPLLTDETPDLDLHAGTLLLEFNEIIDVSTVTLSDITIIESNNGNNVPLTGATLPTSNSTVLEILLTESQRESITLLRYGNNTPLRIDVSTTAIKDVAGNAFAGFSGRLLSISTVFPANTWMSQDSQTDLDILGVHFVNADRGWAVGVDGTLTSTDNGGVTWSVGSVGTDIIIHDVHFVDADRGWAVGDGGALRTTTDGGTNWSNQTSGTTEPLFDVHFVNSTLGWAVGDQGTIISTLDGGLSWNSDTSGTTSDLRGIHFSSPNSAGYAVGAKGTIVSTSGPNDSWFIQPSGVNEILNDVHFVSTGRGWAVGADGTILGTVNNGMQWNVLNRGISVNLNGVHFTSANIGWTAGAGGTIFVTADGGETWDLQRTPTIQSIRDIYFDDSGNGWAVGDNGTILQSALTWVSQDSQSTTRLLDVHFTDTSNGWAVGNSGLVLNTNDGGETWSELDSNVNADIFNVHFLDANNGWAVGNGGTVIATTDGGITWSAQSSGTSNHLRDVQFVDSNNGFAVGSDGTMIVTVNGGTDWTVRTNNGITSDADLRGMHFINSTFGIMVGGANGVVYTTTNAGITTILQQSSVDVILQDVYSLDENRHWAVGDSGTIINTVDGGENWNPQDSGIDSNLTSVHFIDENHGWAAGSFGTIIATFNGGTTWSVQSTPVNDLLYGLHFADPSHGWAVGNNGTILHSVVDLNSPLLINTAPDFDLHAGTLLLEFNEAIDVSATTLSGITITDSNGENGVTLSGATLPAGDFDTLEISITEPQRQSITLLQNGADTPLQIDVSATAIKDPAGNAFAGITNAELTIIYSAPVTVWTSQDSGVTERLFGIHFIDINNGWASGVGGLALNTNDRGVTWSEKKIDDDFNDTFFDIYFTDLNNGWVVGDGGSIYGTTDGGTTWSLQTNGTTTAKLYAVHFVDSDRGWAAGNGGTILSTTDGGDNWLVRNFGAINIDLHAIHFVDANRGWAAGTGSRVLSTTDGGASWNAVNIGFSGEGTLFGLHFIDANRGWVVGHTSQLTSGIAFTVNASTENNVVWSQQVSGISNEQSTAFNDVHFVDADNGWLVGRNNTILATSNGGTTWGVQSIPTSISDTVNSINAIHFTDLSHGWAVGDNGIILRGFFSDTQPPLLTDQTPDIDFNTAILTFEFDGVIDVSETMLDEIVITDSNGENGVKLTGATLPVVDSDILAIGLTDTQRLSIITLNQKENNSIRITVNSTTIYNVDGTAFAGLVNSTLTITSDDKAPTLVATPNLNLVVGTLYFNFNEYIDVSTINLSGIRITDSNDENGINLTGATLPAADTNTVTIGLTDTQRLSIIALNQNENNSIRITVNSTAISDVGGTFFVGLDGAELTITTDIVLPMLTDQNPHLNLGTGILSFDFSEQVNVPATILSGITITDGKNEVKLNGASLPTADSNTLAITLTELQRAAIILLNQGTNTSLQITVNATAIRDNNGNYFAGITNAELDITSDSIAPILDDLTPHLNLLAGTLYFNFDEKIDISAVVLSEITITDNKGENGVALTGATLPDSDNNVFTVTLTPVQDLLIQSLQIGTESSPVQMNVTSTAIRDISGNHFAGLVNAPLTITFDLLPPRLEDTTPDIDLGTGATLSFNFYNHVDVSETILSGITIINSIGENNVSLAGATLPDADSDILTIGVTETQRQPIIELYLVDTDALSINVTPIAIRDPSANFFSGLTAVDLTVTPDTDAPILDDTAPRLNLETGTLHFNFNEAINVSAIILSGITITDANGENEVSLAGATLPSSNTDAFTITLTDMQNTDINELYTLESPVQINVSATAIQDTSGNHFVGLVNGALAITTDITGPILDETPDLNLDALATLSFDFNEPVDVSEIKLSEITITDSAGQNEVALTGAIRPDTDSDTITITLSSAQKQSISLLQNNANTSDVRINVSGIAIEDVNGNAFVGIINGTLMITSDTTAPTLLNDTPNLDLQIAGTLSFEFDEIVDVSATTLSEIRITDSNGENEVSLADATLSDTYSDVLIITLNLEQLLSLRALHADEDTSIQVTVSNTAIEDLAGNAFAGLVNATLSTNYNDTTPPTLTDLTPNLDIAAATLTFAFDEHINVSTISLQNISITDAAGTDTVLLTGATLPATNSSSVIIGLTTAQIQQLGTLTFDDDAGTPLQITVSPSAITDLTGNAFLGLDGTAIDTTDDSTAPTLTSTTLNLDTAILVLTFNEAIVWSDTTLDNITITDSNNANPVTLTGANLTDNNLPTLTITLTESQRQSVVTLNTGSNSPVQITVAANSIHDLVGNVFAPLTNGALTITDDNTPPTLTDLTPNLDIAAATLSFAFDEHINVSTISLQNISITDTTGTDTVLLTGATLPATNSSSVIIGLTTAQIQQLGTLTFDDNAGTPLQITVSPSAITDLTGNAFGGLVAGTAIDTTDDSTAPTLTSTTLNLDTAILVLTFNEAIVWSDTTLDNITITDSNNANPVTLTGANLTDNNLPTLTITLTESQRQSVVTLNTGSNSPVQITVAANSIHDLVGNVFAPLTNGALTITDDNTPPTLTDLTPNLDITAATLSFAFDEHINVSTISLQNISITDTAGTDTVLLTGATLPATNSSSFIIGLTTAQIQQLGTLTFDDNAGTPLQITVSPSAITDLTGNAFGGLVAGTAIDTTDDSTAPTLTSTTLNLDTAILVLTFNEAIVWSDTTLDNITITDSNNANPVTLTGANLTDNNLPTLTITLTESQRQSVVTLNTGSNSPVQITVAANSIHDLVGNVFAPLTNGALTITDDNTPPTLTDNTPNLDITAATLTFAFDEHINVSTISLQNISITDATGTDTVLLTGATLPATNSSSFIIGLTTAQVQQLGTLTFDDSTGTPLQITVSPSAITDLTGNAFGGLVAGTAIDTTDDSTAPTLTSTTLNLDTAILVLTFNEAIVWSDTTLDNITITDSNNANPVTLTGANLTDNNLPTLTITLTESQRQSVVTLNTGSNSPVQITVAANSIHDLVGNVFAPLTNGALTITDDNTPPTLTDLTPNLNIAAATLSFAFDEHINVSTISLQNISITDTAGTDTVLLTGATLPATNSSSFIIGLTTAQVQQLGTLTFDDNAGTPLQITVSPSAITDLTGNAFGGLVAGTAIDTTDDSTAPTLTSTTLNLDTAILVLTFNEAIVWSDTTLDNITITDSNNANPVTLTGANLTDNNLPTLTITLTESQRQSVVTLNTGSNSPVQITVAANSIHDLVGNVFAPLTNGALTITDDNTPPTLTDLTPNLNIAAATLSFAFDEHINVSTISLQNISITDTAGTDTVLLTGATLPATNSSSFIIGLTTAQVQQLGTLTFDDNAGTPLQITVSPSAITDLTGNAFGGLVAGTAIDTTDDSTAPTLTSTTLNLDTAILVLTFNEAIVWSDTTLDNITITDSNNANPVTLTGANLTDNNLPTLTITLTESQRQSVVTLNTGSNSPVQITVAANSIHDLVGNVFAPLTNGALTITDDNTPPTLTDLTPNLNIAAATLSFAFDEHINVSTISLQNISITDTAGTDTVLLTGATLPATNSSSFIIGLTTAQVQQLGTLTFDDNAGTPLQITVSPSAITDLTGNAFGGLVAGTAIDTTDDSTAPTLTSTTLNLDTAILVLTFNEAIVWSDTTLDNITITDSNNANPVTLTGANLTDNNLPTLTITLTESQRQSVVTLNTGSNSPVQITVAANSIHDIVGNVFAPLTNGALTITDDNTPPTLTDPTPNLDITAATLSFAFDEHINVSTISLQNISITDAAGTDTVLLTGATLPATNSSSFIIGLTTAQIQQLGTLTFDDNAGTPLQITVSPSAITDLTGNAFGGLVAGTAIDTTDDSTAPTLTSTTLNLDTAILVLTFNEAIVWSDTTLDNITITDSNNANPVTLTGANLTDNNLPTLTITLTESQRQSVVTLNTGSNSPVQITVAANSIHDLVGNVFAPLTNGALTITDDNTPPTLTDNTPNLDITAATLTFAFDEHINVSTISLQNISITDATGTDTVLLTGATLPATNSSSVIIGLTTAQIQQLGTLTFDDDTPLQITVSPSAITDLTGNAFGGLVAGTAIDTTDDSTAPTLTSTTLNLDTAILVLTFNEAIVWSDTTLDNITITDSNNANPVTLTGANLTDNNLPTLTITLTESQRQSVVTLNTGSNSPVQITVAANSIHDLVGNVFAPLTNGALTITDDNTPPTLTDNTPNLNIAAATLSFAFDEHINVSTISLQNISITDAAGTDTVLLTGATLPATNSSSVIIGLTTAQIQQLGTLTFDDNAGTPLQITVSPSAITDLTGNAFGGLVAGTAIDTTDDSTAPTLTSTTLNLDTAILVLTFNEAIVWSDTTLDNITITDSNNANPVTLTGANLTDNNLPTLTITLTESQRQSVVTLNTGSNSPVQITVAANSIHDLVGNVFASLTNGALTITDDNTPPTLTDNTPNLDITAATLTFAFDEHINVSTISLQNISITDATGTDTVLLTGATLPATNSSSFIIGLTTAQVQQLGTLTFDDNAGTPLQITVSPSAITDLTGNAFGGLVAGTAIDTTDDSTAPTLTSTTLNLDTAILVLTFNEAIVWSNTTLDNITITDSNNANPVTLTGANLTDNNLPTLTITLTESQRQSVVTLNTGSNSPVQITVAANSIHDLVGNVFASLTNGALTITDDNTPPTLTDNTPNLDITAATLTFAFDEHINVSTISLQNISITDATGTDTVLLTGATLPATNSSSFIIGLTTAQIQQLGTLTFDDNAGTPLQITVSPSAITDLTGNAFGGLVAGTAIDTTDDSTAPTLTSTTLNLDTAILVLTFNEAIVWSNTTLDNITITDSNNANPVTLTGANLTDNNLPTLTITLTESQRQSVVTLNTGSNSPVQITVAANSIHDLVGNVFASLTNGALTITDDNTPPTLTDNTPNLDITAATLTFAFDEHINVSTISLQNISITDATGTDTVLLTGATLPATNSSSVIIGLLQAPIQYYSPAPPSQPQTLHQLLLD